MTNQTEQTATNVVHGFTPDAMEQLRAHAAENDPGGN